MSIRLDRQNSIFTYSSLWSFSDSVFLFVLSVVHSFLFAIVLSFLCRGSYWSMVFLLVFTHHIFVRLLFHFFFYFLRGVLELSDVSNSQLLQIFRLPLFSLLFLSFYDICIQSLSILTDGKFLIIVHRYFWIINFLLIGYLQTISSASSWKSLTYLWAKASAAV
jgi:hypothetical protein